MFILRNKKNQQILLRSGTIAMQSHFTVAMGLIWPIAIVIMHHSSDGAALTSVARKVSSDR
jgi:hypothetical protein